MSEIRTILHPTDFSEGSRVAFELARSLARDYRARLVIMHAETEPTVPAIGGVTALTTEKYEEGLRELLRRRQEEAGPVTTETRLVLGGHAPDRILATAVETGADLIVMGTHGRSGFRRAVLGSVAEAVMRKAPCPVVTVRPSATLPADKAPVEGDGEAGEPVAEDWNLELGVVDPVREVAISVGPHARPTLLRGTLRSPPHSRGVVVFAPATGRDGPRNHSVAAHLISSGFCTLLVDLLTDAEAEEPEKVFDIPLLADRLVAVIGWLADEPEAAGLPVGLFAASTGGAAVLRAAASHPDRVSAVVSRGGRPDLAWEDVPAVRAPTLLIVGDADEPTLGWNREALARLTCPKELAAVAGATHLFEEPGALEKVAELAGDWFTRHLTVRRNTPAGTTM